MLFLFMLDINITASDITQGRVHQNDLEQWQQSDALIERVTKLWFQSGQLETRHFNPPPDMCEWGSNLLENNQLVS